MYDDIMNSELEDLYLRYAEVKDEDSKRAIDDAIMCVQEEMESYRPDYTDLLKSL